MSNVREGILVGIGNPLLDITVQGDESLLSKYKLLPNNAIIAEEFQLPLYQEITSKYNPEYTAGGSTQNSLRVCQWVLKEPKACVFMGSVGTDSYSAILKKKAEEDGVNVRYQYQKDVPTGVGKLPNRRWQQQIGLRSHLESQDEVYFLRVYRGLKTVGLLNAVPMFSTCAVIVTVDGDKHYRSLCANLAAANCFTKDHIMEPENMELIAKADYFYIGGFFQTVSPVTIMTLAEIADTQNKVLLTNLSAQFICQAFTEPLMNLMPYVQVLFGNETEAEALAMTLNFGTKNIKEIAQKISVLPKKNESKDRVVIITQGHLPVILVKDGAVSEIPVTDIPVDRIVDTNGAGDAFVGGFLSQYIRKKPTEACINCGIWTATQIIQNSGCTFDPKLSYPS